MPNFKRLSGLLHPEIGREPLRRRGRGERLHYEQAIRQTEDDSMKKENEADEFADNSISEEELLLAARRSFLFLSACVDGEIADAKVTDRILAARGLLEHAVKVPRVFDELLTGVAELSDEDVGLIATALD